jgi:hypothetical protein
MDNVMAPLAPFVDQNFAHDAARGISGAEKEDMIRTFTHGWTIKVAVDGHKRLNWLLSWI